MTKKEKNLMWDMGMMLNELIPLAGLNREDFDSDTKWRLYQHKMKDAKKILRRFCDWDESLDD